MSRYPVSSSGNIVRYRPYSLPVILCLIFALFGLAAIVIGFVQHFQSITLLQRGVSVQGTVVSIEDRSDSDSTFYCPVVHFTPTGSDRTVEFTGRSHGTLTERVGDSVPVLYLPEDTQKAQIESDVRDWKGTLLTLAFGCAFVLIGGLSARQLMRGVIAGD